jgi:hypothetical protein
MNFGYLIVVSSSSSADYLKMAYALAMSIKHTQKAGYDKVALVIDNPALLDNLKSPWVFDHVIEWRQETYWDGRSWMDKLSPFDATVCLDADMLFFRDYSHWIDYFLENSDLYIVNKVKNYRGDIAVDEYYRRCFKENDLPNLYSLYTFFKKNSPVADDFFELGRYIIKNPKEFTNHFLSKFKPKQLGTDEAFSLSAKLLGIDNEISYDLDFPEVLHLKPMIQGWPWPAEKWSDHVGFYFNKDCYLKIGNYQQTCIVHYVEKDKITDEVIGVLEEAIWKK